MPVPTNGASVRTSGTAWRCMFEPISARLASSFSRNGISAAATETSCFGDTSMKSTLSRGTQMDVAMRRQTIRSSVKRPRDIESAHWPARRGAASSMRRQILDLVGDPAVLDLAVRRLDEAELVDARDTSRATRSGRCSALPASRSGRCGRNASDARRAPRSRRGRGVRPPGPSADKTALVRELGQRVGLVHELRQLARQPKNSRTAAAAGFALIRSWRHHGVDIDDRHAL